MFTFIYLLIYLSLHLQFCRSVVALEPMPTQRAQPSPSKLPTIAQYATTAAATTATSTTGEEEREGTRQQRYFFKYTVCNPVYAELLSIV